MKPPKRSTDLIFGTILAACVVVMIGSGVAYALGWEDGLMLLYVAGVFANFPMFHFAMHWPYRDKNKPDGPS